MPTLFQNKYRNETARLRTWDYSREGMYFVTICTADRECYFGKVRNGKIELSETGKIAESEWFKTPELRPDMNLQLGEFVVMPNHVHGVIIIGENEYNNRNDGGIRRDAMHRVPDEKINSNHIRDAMHGVPTDDTMDLTNIPGISGIPATPISIRTKFGPQSKNLSSIIRGYKSAVTTWARKNYVRFGWQPRFYDHIIRNDIAFTRISDYIINNSGNWEEDKLRS